MFKNIGNINFKNILFHLAYINNFAHDAYLSPVYWTFGIEFQFYILIGVLSPYLFQSKYIAISCLLALNILSFFWEVEYAFVLNFISFFTLGILTYMYKTTKIIAVEFYCLTMILLFYMLFHLGNQQTIAAMATCFFIIFLSKSHPINDFFSKISFSLYLTHDIIGSQLVILIGNLFEHKNIYTKVLAFQWGWVQQYCLPVYFIFLLKKRQSNIRESSSTVFNRQYSNK